MPSLPLLGIDVSSWPEAAYAARLACPESAGRPLSGREYDKQHSRAEPVVGLMPNSFPFPNTGINCGAAPWSAAGPAFPG